MKYHLAGLEFEKQRIVGKGVFLFWGQVREDACLLYEVFSNIVVFLDCLSDYFPENLIGDTIEIAVRP